MSGRGNALIDTGNGDGIRGLGRGDLPPVLFQESSVVEIDWSMLPNPHLSPINVVTVG